MTVRVEQGDCREVIPRLVTEGVAVDSVVTDPPYGLEFMGKDWDAPWQMSSQSTLFGKRERTTPGWGVTRNANCRRCGGRLRGAKKCSCEKPDWDEHPNSTRLRQMASFQDWSQEWAEACFEILRPGGFLLAFGGTRTAHRTVCGIENAGFVIQDTIAWMYGSGFPKHKSALKPAFEPVCVAYKPGAARSMQVDECRIETAESLDGGAYGRNPHRRDEYSATDTAPRVVPFSRIRRGVREFEQPVGRWPANVIHDGGDEVEGAFAAFGESGPSRSMMRGLQHSGRHGGLATLGPKLKLGTNNIRGHDDMGGSAARFYYAAKADATDRWHSRHPTVKPVDLMRYLVALVTPPGGTVLDPFAGSGTTGTGATLCGRHAILVEAEPSYVADIRERMAALRGEATLPTPRARSRRDPRDDLLSDIEGDRT